MAGIDNRIVTMKFDNAQFESGARTSLSTLQKLKENMNFSSVNSSVSRSLGGISSLFAKFGIKNPFSTATQGAADLDKAAGQVATGGLTEIHGGITGISNRFLAMSTIAITALSNITTKAMETGRQLVSSLTIDPIKGGLEEYETNLNSIQTILANTKVAGTGLDDVNKALDELNHYSDQTIYNFSEMAKNIGTFTAAGVDLDTSVASIKGIANLAALSGSNSQQAATAMYQLSQEIAAGRVSLMGWNSVVNAGMGGSTFQRALVRTAQNMGELKGHTVEFTGEMKNATIDGQSFRDSIMAKPGEESWLSKEVLTGTLAQFTGDMTDAELAAQGFTKAQIKDIQEMAKTAKNAATKVKTLSGVFDTAKEVVGSGWAKTWQLVFGDFKEARKFFTDFSNGFNDILSGIANRRNEVLSEWKLVGGRDMAIEGLKTMWESLLTILRPIGDAFRDIFPATTSQDLLELTRNFVEFAKNLAISKDTAEGLHDTFAGVFAIFHILGQVIGAVAHGIGVLFGAIGEGSGGFLDFTGGLGNMLVAFDSFLEKSGVLTSFFGGLGRILSVPIRLLSGLAHIIGGLFEGFQSGMADRATGVMERFGDGADALQSGADRVMAVVRGIGEVIGNISDVVVSALSNIGNAIAGAITPETFEASLHVINTALLGGIVLILKKFFSGGLNVNVGEGFFDQIKGALEAVTGTLQNMQANLKADVLLKIAGALGILAASLLILSTIDTGDLIKAMAAMAGGFMALQYAMVSLNTAIGLMGAAKLPLIAAAMVLLATSMAILAGAMKIFATMDLYEIARALVAMGGALIVISKTMSAMPKSLPVTAAGVLILSVALNVLAGAMKIFATMNWEEMAKGLVGIVGSLTAIALAMKLMPKSIPITAAGVLILSVALNALAGAMKIFATMSWEEMAKGLVGIAGALVAIGLAMNLMPVMLPLTAAGLVLVGIALNGIAGALKIMGGQSWEEIAKGLVTLAGSILILAAGLNAMGPMAIAGAAALAIATAALVALTPVLVTLGAMSWGMILKSLVTLAGVFTILGLAGLVLAPVVPVIFALGAALLLIGGGLALAGVGALAFATAFGIVVSTSAAATGAIGRLLGNVVKAIPGFLKALAKGLGQFAVQIAKNQANFTRAMSSVLSAMLDAVIKNVPKMGQAFLTMLNTALRVITTAAPRIVRAGLDLIINFLQAISSRIGRIVDLAASIIVKFLDGISRNIGRIIQSGVNLIVRFVEGVANAINNNSRRVGEAGGDLAVAMVNGVVNGLAGAGGAIGEKLMDLAQGAWEQVKNFFKIGSPSKLMRDELGARLPQGMALGIRDDAPLVVEEMSKMGKSAIDKLGEVMRGVDEAFALDPNLNPTISPVLDLTALTKEANKMSDILATAPIMPGVSYATAVDISTLTQPPPGGSDNPDDPTYGSGDQYVTLEQHLHSPKPIDSVESYRAGKTLISLAKEALK